MIWGQCSSEWSVRREAEEGRKIYWTSWKEDFNGRNCLQSVFEMTHKLGDGFCRFSVVSCALSTGKLEHFNDQLLSVLRLEYYDLRPIAADVENIWLACARKPRIGVPWCCVWQVWCHVIVDAGFHYSRRILSASSLQRRRCCVLENLVWKLVTMNPLNKLWVPTDAKKVWESGQVQLRTEHQTVFDTAACWSCSAWTLTPFR